MTEKHENEREVEIGFWSNWRNLYIFIIVYAVLQILILYWFTKTFNQP